MFKKKLVFLILFIIIVSVIYQYNTKNNDKVENFIDESTWNKIKGKYIQTLLINNEKLEQKIMDGTLPFEKLQYLNARIQFIKNMDFLYKNIN